MRLRWSWFNTLAAAGLVACSTPSVPIPPPVVDLAALTFIQASAGTVTLAGKANPMHDGAQFFVTDQATGDGVITRASSDGSFTTAAFAAAAGDTIRISLEASDGRDSDEYCVTLTIDAPVDGDICPVANPK